MSLQAALCFIDLHHASRTPSVGRRRVRPFGAGPAVPGSPRFPRLPSWADAAAAPAPLVTPAPRGNEHAPWAPSALDIPSFAPPRLPTAPWRRLRYGSVHCSSQGMESGSFGAPALQGQLWGAPEVGEVSGGHGGVRTSGMIGREELRSQSLKGFCPTNLVKCQRIFEYHSSTCNFGISCPVDLSWWWYLIGSGRS